MSAEVIARLRNARTAVRTGLVDGQPPETYAMVNPDDLRVLLEANDTAHARGVAEERARVVAALEKRAWMLPKAERQALLSAVDRIKRGEREEGT